MPTRKVHIMRLAPDDIRTSKVRARSIRTNDPNLRLVYYELLFALHSSGGVLPSDPAALADELCLEPAVIAKALDELDTLSRIPGTRGGIRRENGHVWNQRIVENLAEEQEFRESQAEHGRKGASIAGKGRPKTPISDRATPNEALLVHGAMPNPPVPTPLPTPLPLEAKTQDIVDPLHGSTPSKVDRKPSEKEVELEWRIGATWEAHLKERDAFYREENGKNPPPVALTPDIRKAIREAILRHDGSFLKPEDREEWRKRSSARAAGIGLFLSPWHTGSDKDNDYRAGTGKRYLESWRPWKPQRGKPDPVPTFAALYFESKEDSL